MVDGGITHQLEGFACCNVLGIRSIDDWHWCVGICFKRLEKLIKILESSIQILVLTSEHYQYNGG